MNRKICFVGTEITPSDGSTFVGGHVNTVVMLCKGLSKLNWDIHIVTTPSRFLKKLGFKFPWAKFHVVKPTGSYSSLTYGTDFFIKAISTIKYLHKQEKFDLVHAHSGYFSASFIPIIVKRKLFLPSIFSLYCPAKMFPGLSILDKYGVKLLSKGLDKIIAVSNNVKESLLCCGVDETKIEVIPPCFDEKTFNPLVFNDCSGRMDSNIKYVLFVGNVDRTKGLDVFLRAAKPILQENLNVKFVVTLHESDKIIKKVATLASRRLGSAVEVKGVVENMARLMASVDIVVVPFRNTDGIADIPLVVLEAMAVGKPVIASDIGGVKEVVFHEKNGLLVRPDNVDELTEAMLTLLKDSALRETIIKEGLRVVKRFSYSEISRELDALYNRIIDGNVDG